MVNPNSTESKKYHRILNMKPKFKKAVDAGDLVGVRISLASEMMLDPRGESFNEMRKYAEKELANLYEEHDGTIFDNNRENWSEKLLFSTRNALDDNFSKERLDFYAEIAKEVLKEKANQLQQEESIISTKQASQTASSGRYDKHKLNMQPLSTCLAIGGLFVGGAGLVLGRGILTAIGVISAAIGGYQIYNDNKE